MSTTQIGTREILTLARENFEFAREIRRHLHRHPELSFHEFETADYVEKKLHELGLFHIKRINQTGVVALLKNNRENCVALRADLDALPITETDDREYRSLNEGVMHACGHDAHTAALLGAAKILCSIRDKIKGNIKFIFQPGEEVLPGGASLLIEQGVLNKPEVVSILGQHTSPEIETGKFGIKAGAFMASTDELHLVFKGKGGHAALAHTYINPLLPASSFLPDTTELVNSLGKNKSLPSVIAFGKIIGNGATNIIPESVKLEGTFRAFDEEWRTEVHQLIHVKAKQHAEKFNCVAEVEIKRGYPALINNDELTGRVKTGLKEIFGQENILDLDLRMTAEDFAYYSQKIPSCFYRWGTGNKAKNITAMNHTAQFDIDEDSLIPGMAGLVISALNEIDFILSQ